MFDEVKRLILGSGTKVYVYFGKRTIPEDYDEEEKNVSYTDLNPHVIKAWVTNISPEKLQWKNYGLQETGAVEILCDSKYRNWFESCNKVVINNKEYSVFKSGVGNRALIYDRPANMIRVILQMKDRV